MNDDTIIPEDEVKQKPPFNKPDELSGLLLEAKIKIFDKDTGEVIIEGRA